MHSITVTLVYFCLLQCFVVTLGEVISPLRGGDISPNLKVCYQGEPGAYSEKSLRSLLGPSPISVGRKSFEDCFRSVSTKQSDYCLLPFENSLGGSIHENYDLMLRYDLTIVAEHEFRVNHCFIVSPGVKTSDIKYAISHPQALKQCDNWLRARNIIPIPTYDTAGSAKMLKEDKNLPEGCTKENTAAIASDLAASTYGMDCRCSNIEDDDSNFTRFLLLSRKPLAVHSTKDVKCKTSIVFTLEETPGALYKALACFSLRDVDFSKIESRPTSASLLSYLRFRGKRSETARFRYCFYLDFLDSDSSEKAVNALDHLREGASYVRVLGCYPVKSNLVGKVAEDLKRCKDLNGGSVTRIDGDEKRLVKIGIVGKTKKDWPEVPDGVKFIKNVEDVKEYEELDVVVVASEDALKQLPSLPRALTVLEGSLMSRSRSLALGKCKGDVMICHLCPEGNGKGTLVWDGVRMDDVRRGEDFLRCFSEASWKTVEMDCKEHDDFTAKSQFAAMLTGRVLSAQSLKPSPVNTSPVMSLFDVAETGGKISFDEFFKAYKHTSGSRMIMRGMREALAEVEREIEKRQSYLEAKDEMQGLDRLRVLEEVKKMIREEKSSEQKKG
ncbi:hypothetical protein TrST_g13127 [Triparma strigata]|uniref:Prephenate dehydratase n=1 Tax=Triparma strigata TaxID=1606541 RepID=A0A9W7C404_9STRA|nr:hypothetical protein TrST_g13127 [Triparma strigata]